MKVSHSPIVHGQTLTHKFTAQLKSVYSYIIHIAVAMGLNSAI